MEKRMYMIHTELIGMSYEELVEYLEKAVGYKLNLPESLDEMSALDLEFLILNIQSIDLIYSGWSPYMVHAIKQALIKLIKRKLEEEQEAGLFDDAVRGLGMMLSM